MNKIHKIQWIWQKHPKDQSSALLLTWSLISNWYLSKGIANTNFHIWTNTLIEYESWQYPVNSSRSTVSNNERCLYRFQLELLLMAIRHCAKLENQSLSWISIHYIQSLQPKLSQMKIHIRMKIYIRTESRKFKHLQKSATAR